MNKQIYDQQVQIRELERSSSKSKKAPRSKSHNNQNQINRLRTNYRVSPLMLVNKAHNLNSSTMKPKPVLKPSRKTGIQVPGTNKI